MKKILIFLVVILVAGGIAFGLTRNNNNSTNTTTSPNPSPSAQNNTQNTTPNPNPSSSSNSNSTPTNASSITINNFAFSPADITIKKGTNVTWTNKDSVAHTVQETDGKNGPKSGSLSQNDTYSFTYNETGTFKYHCSIHPDMTGTVTVTE
jgi:plastocyanin